MKAGKTMNYTMRKTAANIVVMEMENKTKITIRFKERDNPDIENIVTDNLMMSYERRIKAVDKIM